MIFKRLKSSRLATLVAFIFVAALSVAAMVLFYEVVIQPGSTPNTLYSGRQLESHLSRLSQVSEVMACVKEYELAKGEAEFSLADRISILAQKGMSYCAGENISLKQIIAGYDSPEGMPELWMIEPKSCTGLLHELHLYCPTRLLEG